MPITRTVRYAAKEAYQLMLMTGKSECTIAGCHCNVMPTEGYVYVVCNDIGKFVPIAKSWMYL